MSDEEIKKKKKKKIINKLIDIVKSPYTVGLSITIFLTYTSYYYYNTKNDLAKSHDSLLFKVVEYIDQKNLDFKFLLRGPQLVKNKVAILAIDDKSLTEVGRWPWGRDKMAQLIDKTMSYGARAIGFDIVFSEPQENPVKKSVDEIKSLYPNIPQDLQHVLDQQIQSHQADDKFAAVVDKHKDKLIMGSFYEETNYEYEPYQEICLAFATQKMSSNNIANSQANPTIVLDNSSDSVFLQAIEQTFPVFFDGVFADIEANAKNHLLKQLFNKNDETELNAFEKAQLHYRVENEYTHFCKTWLTQEDQYFQAFKDNFKALFQYNKNLLEKNIDVAINEFKNSNKIFPLPSRGAWTVNIPTLSEKSIHTAFFNAQQDADGTIRRSALVHRTGSVFLNSLAFQTYLVANNYQAHMIIDSDPKYPKQKYLTQIKILTDPENDDQKFFNIPVNKQGSLIINYAGPQKMIPHLSASELFHDRPKAQIEMAAYDKKRGAWGSKIEYVDKAEFIKDTIFVVGATAVGVYDLRVTPFEKNYPGVETHANIINNLLDQKFLYNHPKEDKFMTIGLAVGGLILTFALAHAGAVLGLAITLVFSFIVFLIDFYGLFKHGIVATMTFPIFLVVFMYLFVTFYKYFTEERKKKHLRSTFSKYVSPAIVDEILKDPENIELGGRKQRMTVMFSDVRGFTTISEKLDPQVLSKVLNDYLTPMTQIVFANNGTLDKYMGDAIMAFFGAPIFFEDHAKYACRCALESIRKLKELQKEFAARGLPEIDIGIGLNSAEMSVGNMGSDIVRSYTVMGDAVNLGSRLEGINKEYGTRIIISEFTYEDVKSSFTAREVDWVKVKGKNKPVRIFELICEGRPEEVLGKSLEHFQKGFDLYHKQLWNEALEEFKQSLELTKEDPVSELYVERCEEFKQNPPAENWDGVFTMKTK